MAKERNITAERVRQLLDYDPITGVLTWKFRPDHFFKEGKGIYTASAKAKTWNKRWAGKSAGWLKPNGYKMVCVEWSQIREHHIIWLIMTGEWPKDQIDHINGIRDDNRFINLREATGPENQQNMKLNAKNTSGYNGVSWHGQTPKWTAYINAGGKRHHLGMFDNREDAHVAHLEAKKLLHHFQPIPRE